MAEFVERHYLDETVQLDGDVFRRCIFTRSTVVYSGGEVPELFDCEFKESFWQFAGGAGRTLAMLAMMHRSGISQLIEAMFEDIRSGRLAERSTRDPAES